MDSVGLSVGLNVLSIKNNPPVTGAPFPAPPPWNNVHPALFPFLLSLFTECLTSGIELFIKHILRFMCLGGFDAEIVVMWFSKMCFTSFWHVFCEKNYQFIFTSGEKVFQKS